jgi:glycosyltransferase involved in cell wall biosynthesis
MSAQITVIINSYNYGRYIRQAIESVIGQGYPNKQIVVVDDGSTDDSRAIIHQYRDVAKIISHRNMGQARSCLVAARHATGDIIQFLDSDDYLLPGALSQIVQKFETGVSKVQFQLCPINSNGETVGRPWPIQNNSIDSRTIISRIRRNGCYASPPTSGNAYRADVVRSIGSIDYESSIDGIIYLYAPFVGEIRHINHPLASYRYHDANYSQHGKLDPRRLRDEIRIHHERIKHLNTLVQARDSSFVPITNTRHHSVVLIKSVMKAVCDGNRPSLSTLLRYCGSAFADRIPPVKLVQLVVWSLAVYLSPRDLRIALATYKACPLDRSIMKLLRAAFGKPPGGAERPSAIGEATVALATKLRRGNQG